MGRAPRWPSEVVSTPGGTPQPGSECPGVGGLVLRGVLMTSARAVSVEERGLDLECLEVLECRLTSGGWMRPHLLWGTPWALGSPFLCSHESLSQGV